MKLEVLGSASVETKGLDPNQTFADPSPVKLERYDGVDIESPLFT